MSVPIPDNLNAKQAAFCQEYIIDKNATQAALRAGYSPRTASRIGADNLRKPVIKAYIDALLAEQAKAAKVTASRVIDELASVGFFRLSEVVSVETTAPLEIQDGKLAIAVTRMRVSDSASWSDAAQKSIESIKQDKDGGIQIKTHSKIQALKQLGDHLGLFKDLDTLIRGLEQYGEIQWLEDNSGFTFTYAEDTPQTA